ncbi:MAG: EDSAP-1 family PEP-CTERM protein [Thiobacillus sp.]|nr:EDSAP-1 family PEP-CTERM protein [Thiobacillus sp.]
MNRKLTSLALASLGVLALPTAAHAYVMASSVVEINNFTLSGSSGAPLTATDFSFLTFVTSADQSVSLTGSGGGSDGDSASSSTGSINFDPICVGNGCSPIGNDLFPKLSAPPVTGNYAAADQLETGSPVAGIAGFTTPAFVKQGTYVGIDLGSADGSTSANNNLNSSFVFSLTQSTGVTFDFDITAWLQVAMTSDEDFPGYASASASFTISILDITPGGGNPTVFSYNTALFGAGEPLTLSLNAPLPGMFPVYEVTRDATNVAFSVMTPTLTAGRLYQTSFRSTSQADAGRIPEPGVLALLGMGLLGLGLTRRRKLAA